MTATSAAAHIRRKAETIAAFIQKRLAALPASRTERGPMLVSMQGPQGAGKSTLAATLIDVLAEKNIHCAVASLDDFYLPYTGLKALASAHPNNTLLSGRGPPGTHDLPLLSSTLSALSAHPTTGSPVQLPSFDKSKHGGYGDRAPSDAGVKLNSALDVFVLEGWSLGYGPLPEADVRAGWKQGRTAQKHPYESLAQLNSALRDIETATQGAFDAHVAIKPLDYDFVYTWRTEQEHKMKAKNGGEGMTDEGVRAFVDRYMPVYEVWGEVKPPRPTLTLTFGPERDVVASEESE